MYNLNFSVESDDESMRSKTLFFSKSLENNPLQLVPELTAIPK